MKLAIDASNIRTGGGLTHLLQLLKYAQPQKYGFQKVIVWANQNTLNHIPDSDWLVKRNHPLLNKSNVFSFLFQFFLLSWKLKKDKVDLLFVPGGSFIGSFKQIVSMSQNMLPFEAVESGRFQSKKAKLKFFLLKKLQTNTFQKSRGVIFLTNYAAEIIKSQIRINAKTRIISHGTDDTFFSVPKEQFSLMKYSFENPFKLLYVSIVTDYKHQWNISEAVLKLRKEGYPIELILIGPSTTNAMEKLNKVIKLDQYNCIKYLGKVDYNEINIVYKNSNGFIFGSTCENQPIILIEAMSSGLPILSSKYGPMPEVLEDAGIYFDPLDVNSIYHSIKLYLNNKSLREQIAEKSFEKAKKYSWQDCSNNTFDFLSLIANIYYENPK